MTRHRLLVLGVASWIVLAALLRFAALNGRLGAGSLARDPERTPPQGRALVAPADGYVLYVRRVEEGSIPYVVKRGVAVPVDEHLKTRTSRPFGSGWLVGIYMPTHGVHVNRSPDSGRLLRQSVYNGPHMNMTRAELRVILGQMIPGAVELRKLAGLDPYAIEDAADYVLKSARETLEFEMAGGRAVYVVRIADFYVGRILTWVRSGEPVARGQRLGMITWGSQTDVLFEDGPGTEVVVRPGSYVYGGESVLARY